MKKILFSILALVVVLGLVGAGAFAYFSDTETSNGNTFTAGTLNLVVVTSGNGPQGKVTVNENGDGLNDNVVFTNLAPGDSGQIVWTLTNAGSLPGMVNIHRQLTNDNDGVNTEPELLVDTNLSDGELDENMNLTSTCTINGVSTFPGAPWYGTYHGTMYQEGTYGDSVDTLPQLLPVGGVLVLTYNWIIPTTVNDVIQGDTFTLDLQMFLDQIP